MKNKAGANKPSKFLIFVLIVFLVSVPILIYSNTHIETEYITYSSPEIPPEFDGARIVHLSDYHNHGGKFDDRLFEKINSISPDYIFITGDMVDNFFDDISKAENFLKRCGETAECYAVWGNHDMSLTENERNDLKTFAENNGVTVLDGETVHIEKGNSHITLTGCISYSDDLMSGGNENDFNIWLHHYPHNFEDIANKTKAKGNQTDLMFAGHAHGGLIRLPFIDGLYAPDQGFFPKYTNGRYEYGGSTMIVSRGIGNVATTLRVFDTFHIVVCELKRSES